MALRPSSEFKGQSSGRASDQSLLAGALIPGIARQEQAIVGGAAALKRILIAVSCRNQDEPPATSHSRRLHQNCGERQPSVGSTTPGLDELFSREKLWYAIRRTLKGSPSLIHRFLLGNHHGDLRMPLNNIH